MASSSVTVAEEITIAGVGHRGWGESADGCAIGLGENPLARSHYCDRNQLVASHCVADGGAMVPDSPVGLCAAGPSGYSDWPRGLEMRFAGSTLYHCTAIHRDVTSLAHPPLWYAVSANKGWDKLRPGISSAVVA